MKKINTLYLVLAIAFFLTACGGGDQSMSTSELNSLLTQQLTEQGVTLTEEQKATIAQMTEESGILSNGMRTSEDKAKYQQLRNQVYQNVLTPEQQSKLKPSN